MKNLFIMHTQYNILSALTVVQQEYFNDINDLLVSAEFDITEEYSKRLKNEFHNVGILQEHFDRTGVWNRATVFANKYKKAKAFLSDKYDRVITAQEQYFDTLLVSNLRKANPNLIWQSVEEDAYYTIQPVQQVGSSISRHVAKRIYYDLYLPLLYGKNPYYEIIPCYGANSGIQTIFLTFPTAARKELCGKDRKEIDLRCLIKATQKLYEENQEDCVLPDKSLVFLSDLISRYPNKDEVYHQICALFITHKRDGYQLYIKYHPRETTPWDFPSEINVIPSSYPSELLLAKNQGKNIVFVGNASTSIIISKKFGYETVSLIGKIGKHRNLDIINFYKNIGIEIV